jgi:hypothetical protein
MHPTDRRKINRRMFLAPALLRPEGEKTFLTTSKNLRTTLDIGSHSNARPELLPEAVAKRRLEAIGSIPWFGWAEVLRAMRGRTHRLLRLGQSNQMECAYWTSLPSSTGTHGH